MLTKKPFLIMMSPQQLLHVDAYSRSDALLAAQDAVPHLSLTSDDYTTARTTPPRNIHIYVLSCLLCAWKPQDNGLVTLQEHLMETHKLSPNDLHHSSRILLGTQKEGCYVWALPSESATHKGLSSLSYMRAAYVDIPLETEYVSTWDRYTTLVFAHSSSSDAPSSQIILVSQDEDAWYGFNDTEAYSAFMRGDAHVGEPTIWPKSHWKMQAFFDETNQ